MRINNFKIDTSAMAGEEITRKFSVHGQIGAEFKIIALQNPSSSSAHTLYYDFLNEAFESGHNNTGNDLQVTLSSNTYNNSITFPSGGGEFVIKLLAVNDTIIQNSKTPVLTKTISKVASNPIITFSPATLNSNNYATFPTTTVTTTPNSNASNSFDWDITNVSNDSYGFGLRIAGTYVKPSHPVIGDVDLTMSVWDPESWYFETTEAVLDNPAGDGEDSKTITVTDVTDLTEGMELQYHKGTTVPTNKAGSAAGVTTLKVIDSDAKTLTFDKDVAFEDGETMTLRAYGFTYIYNATGLALEYVNWRATPNSTSGGDDSDALVSKTVRDGGGGVTDAVDGNSTTISLNGTYGLCGGGFVSVQGVGIDNSSANTIQSVSASSSAGSIVVQVNQTLTVGTVLYFTGSVQTINFNGTISVSNIGTVNRTIYFDLDRYITPGAAS